MISSKNTSKWLAAKVRFLPRTFDIEEVTVEMIGLTDADKQAVQECETSEGMYLAAANFGISSDGIRVSADEYLSDYMEELWADEDFAIDCEPSFRVMVGEKVCEISGLAVFVKAKAKEEAEFKALQEEDDRAEEAKNHLADSTEFNIGGELVSGDTELGNLDPSQLAADALNNAA